MFKNSYLIVPVVIVLTVLGVFIDSKVNDKEVITKDYINAVLFTSLITTLVVFINTEGVQVKSDIIKGPAPF